MCTWINEVENLLGIRREQEAEIKRFLERFKISRVMIIGKEEVPLNKIMDYAKTYYFDVFVDDCRYDMTVDSIPNKPFVSIDLELKIHGRKVHLRNGSPSGKVIDPTSAKTKFSDESHRIAGALAEYWNGEKIIVSCIGSEELIVKLPETDYFVVAYNQIID